MEQSLIDLVLGQTGTAAVAVISLFWLRSSYQEKAAELQQLVQQQREDKTLLIQTLQDNTRAFAALTHAIQELTHDSRRSS